MLVMCNKGTGNEPRRLPRAEECDLRLEEFILCVRQAFPTFLHVVTRCGLLFLVLPDELPFTLFFFF